MAFSFRPAVRENVGLIIGLMGGTGSGKTFTAMRLAAGIVGPKRFAVIDTEAGRAKHYAEHFRFDHCDLAAPFRPDSYLEAIVAADKAGYPVVVVDSMSHEHAGEGGLLDWHEEEYQRLGGREAVKMTAWIKPKMAHKKMVQRLLQVRAHVILCFRAEEKVEIAKDPQTGKTIIIPKVTRSGLDGWTPVCEKTLPYELTASFLLSADAPGIPKPIKLQQQHREIFPPDKPITEESGARLAAWAAGGAIDWNKRLMAAKTLPELAAAWKSIPAADRKTLTATKDSRKAEIEKEAAEAFAAAPEVAPVSGELRAPVESAARTVTLPTEYQRLARLMETASKDQGAALRSDIEDAARGDLITTNESDALMALLIAKGL